MFSEKKKTVIRNPFVGHFAKIEVNISFLVKLILHVTSCVVDDECRRVKRDDRPVSVATIALEGITETRARYYRGFLLLSHK